MTSIFDSNLRVFIGRYPHHKQQIDAALHKNLSDHFSIKNHPLGLELWEGSQLVDSTAERFFEMPPLPEYQFKTAIIAGFGLGSWLQFLFKSQAAFRNVQKWIVVEPSLERFLFSLQQTDFTGLLTNPQIEWQIGLTSQQFFEKDFHYLSSTENLSIGRPYAIFHQPIINAMHHNYFETWKRQWDACLELAKNTHSFFEDGYEGYKNTIRNRNWIAKTPGINLLKTRFSGLPAIVISTGPSLKKSLPLLKKLQNKALLLSADASLKILLKENIYPHFVFCLERDEGSKPFLEGIPSEQCRSHLITFPLVPQSVISAYKGPHWTLYRNYEYYRYFEAAAPRGIIKCGPSVAHMAMNSAAIMGCSSIYLVGQDLSFDPDTLASHPEGIAYEEWGQKNSLEDLRKKLEKTNDQLLYVPGNLQPQVPTSGTYEIFRQVFLDNLNLFSTPVINCTEGGAQIPGIPWKSLAQATRDFKEHDFWKDIETARAEFQAKPEIDLSNLANTLNHYMKSGETTNPLLHHFLGREQIEFRWKSNENAQTAPEATSLAIEWRNRSLAIANKLLELLD